MLLQDVPHSIQGTVTCNVNKLATALESISKYFTHYDTIEGVPCTGRVLMSYAIRDQRVRPAAFSRILDPRDMAEELCEFADEARYSPSAPSRPDMRRGWEIRRGIFRGAPLVIAWAAWCA